MRTLLINTLILFAIFFNAVAVNASVTYEKMTKEQQQEFINKIDKAVVSQNQIILNKRKELLEAYAVWQLGEPLSVKQINWVDHLAQEYNVDDKANNEFSSLEWEMLLRRVDIIPPSLAIAQAINESAWGRSRFAKQANNYYGQWCYTKGCGLVPKERPKGRTYEVRKFSTLDASVASYMKNLNTHYTYKNFRIERAKLRDQGSKIDGASLVPYLSGYSQMGSEYEKYIDSIISSNNLQSLD